MQEAQASRNEVLWSSTWARVAQWCSLGGGTEADRKDKLVLCEDRVFQSASNSLITSPLRGPISSYTINAAELTHYHACKMNRAETNCTGNRASRTANHFHQTGLHLTRQDSPELDRPTLSFWDIRCSQNEVGLPVMCLGLQELQFQAHQVLYTLVCSSS